MFKKKLLILLIITLFLSACGRNQFTEDAAIQKDITIAVNNYNSDDWEIRLNSIKSISKYSDTVYAKNTLLLLFKALNDPHSELRIEALKILKKMKAPGTEEKIGEIATDDENSNVRYYAYSALEEYRDIKNEDIFLQGLDNKDWLVREASLQGLMKIDDPEIQIRHLDTIISAMNDQNVSIKLTAISNISIKNPLIYDELSKIINNEDSGRYLLKAALQKIRGYKLDLKTKKRLIQLLTHRDKNIRLLSLQALRQEKNNLDL